jgi:exodeoxyribonuclease VII large subunit
MINYYPLSRLTKGIKKRVEEVFHQRYWILAEIGKLSLYGKSGHCYLELVEKDANSNVTAFAKAFIWNKDFQRISQIFLQATGKELADGLKIVFECKVVFHEINGFSLTIHNVDPVYTLGEIAKEKHLAMQKLKNQGLWNKNKELGFPDLPQRLAVVSIETSKGYQDFISIIQATSTKFTIATSLYNAPMQGPKAVETIRWQLSKIKEKIYQYDLLLIIRGGGDDTSLNCFDDYNLAADIANFPIPVLTGIGHASNQTIADMVAYRQFVTPSDVAHFVVSSMQFIAQNLYSLQLNFKKNATTFLQTHKSEKDRMAQSLHAFTIRRIRTESQKIEQHWYLLNKHFIRNTHIEFKQLQDFYIKLDLLVAKELQVQNTNIQWLQQKIEWKVPAFWQHHHLDLDSLNQLIQSFDPSHVLQKGFTLIKKGNEIVTDPHSLAQGDTINIEWFNGKASAEIKEINK